jgi:hypothetical protein
MSAAKLTLDDLPVIDFELFLSRGQGWEGAVFRSDCICGYVVACTLLFPPSQSL